MQPAFARAGLIQSRAVAYDDEERRLKLQYAPAAPGHAPTTTATSTGTCDMVKLSEVVDVTMFGEVPKMDPREYDNMCARYNNVFHRPPDEDEEPSIHQLTALLKLSAHLCCYVGFAPWGAHHIRK